MDYITRNVGVSAEHAQGPFLGHDTHEAYRRGSRNGAQTVFKHLWRGVRKDLYQRGALYDKKCFYSWVVLAVLGVGCAGKLRVAGTDMGYQNR